MSGLKHSPVFTEHQREIKALRKDVSTARSIIADGLLRYKKKMLHARSKKQTEDMSMFAELDGYESKQQIHDAYGWNYISMTQMDRLNDLWDTREQVVANQGRFNDRVTQILERAMDNCGDLFADDFEDFDALVRQDNDLRAQLQREARR